MQDLHFLITGKESGGSQCRGCSSPRHPKLRLILCCRFGMLGMSHLPHKLRWLLSFGHHDYIATNRKEEREKWIRPLPLRILPESITKCFCSHPECSPMAIHSWKGDLDLLSLFRGQVPTKDGVGRLCHREKGVEWIKSSWKDSEAAVKPARWAVLVRWYLGVTHRLDFCSSKHSPQASSINVTWRLLEMQIQAPLQPCESESAF